MKIFSLEVYGLKILEANLEIMFVLLCYGTEYFLTRELSFRDKTFP